MWLPCSLIVFTATTILARFSDPDGFENGSDLESFVTRPDIAAPRYVVTKHYPEAISDGYWFVAPYSGLFSRPNPGFRKEHVPCQTGAHIYDNDGVLVWSGACQYSNRNAYGFKPVIINGTQYLSFHQSGEAIGDGVPKQEANVLLDQHYEEHRRYLNMSKGSLDMHEFRVLPDVGTAIMTLQTVIPVNVTVPRVTKRPIINPGFFEIDLATNKTLFQWEGVKDGISLEESWDLKGKARLDLMWDAFHINSVDKDSDGHYYISLRHTNTIYKISKDDRSIIWRLGGDKSNFAMGKGVPFKWQHHIRVRFHNQTHTVVSLFDNGSDDENRSLKKLTRDTSVAKIIMLDNEAMTATLMRSVERPDQGMSEKLGNLQLIGLEGQQSDFSTIKDASIFVNWALQGYVSEFDASNRLLMEARFESERMKTYRAYKYNFVGKPKTKPTVKLLPMAYTQDGHEIASVFYVSWNGATEVRTWTFHGSERERGPFAKLGTTKKNGFETSWVVPGRVQWGYVEALGADGTVLGQSYVMRLESAGNRNLEIPQTEPPAALASGLDLAADGNADTHVPETAPQYHEATSSWQRQMHSDSKTTNTFLVTVLHLIIYGFACVGLYCSAREKVLPRMSRWLNARSSRRSWHEKSQEEGILETALLGQHDNESGEERHGSKRRSSDAIRVER